MSAQVLAARIAKMDCKASLNDVLSNIAKAVGRYSNNK